ncbi:tetratricopeptide repeat protein [Amycolatopsis australiensis]|uniref:DNA-binding transcriptional activator of the SARP family n=1 Tax=Amycolatopsis australiensis TaxID=546364 RepID=A0A1K1T3R8_9PSEU|nr:tetratricopeptide repeat protein [Amycolatopsis australiensis]SFW90991.1 DNA-binding transcriptional activator of the SARP family [Amycolatopsis australiensis]
MEEGLSFAGWLRERRLLAGLTQAQLARRAGLSLRAVRNAELGSVRRPRPETERRLREALAEAPPEPVRIGVLGPLTVRRGDSPVEIGAEKQRLLLAMLALQPNRTVRREDLVDVVWAEPPPSCLDLLHTYVARLRRALRPAGLIATDKGGYRLAAGEDDLDLLRFEALLEKGAYREALELWRGPALADVERLRQHPARLALAMKRAKAVMAYAEVADPEDAAVQLRALTAEEPLDESAHARLMLALAASGRQAAALGVFEEIRRRLAAELGIEPGPELRAAQRQVLRQDFAAPAPPSRVPAQLPADVTGFRGRAAQLAELDALLAGGDPGARIAVLSGTGGVGKTALAVHWAQRHRDRFPDGQLSLDLHGYGTVSPVEPGDALSGFLRALGVGGADIPADPDERAAKFRTLLAGRRMVLLLDNAGSVGQVRPLLPGSPSCLVLVTSRDALPGLVARHGARRVLVDLLTGDEALDLLRTLLGRRAEDEPDATAALIGYAARLPLALRLVAELALSRPGERLAALAAELADEQRRLDLLDGGGDPLTAVRAVFSWSYRHLPADAARVFRLCGLHPGRDLTPSAIAALADVTLPEAERLTGALVRAHLVQETGGNRVQQHDLLRVYAAELAAADPAGSHAARERLFDFYVRSAAQAMDAVLPQERHLRPVVPAPGAEVPDAQAWLEAERRNLLAVAAYATRHGWAEHLRLLSGILWHYLDVGGYHEEALVLHTHASALARDAGDRAAEAEPLTLIALGHWRVGRSREALRYLEEALVLVRETGDRRTEIHVLNTLGLVCRALGRFAEAITYSTEALALARKTGDRTSEGLVLVVLGCSCRGIGRYGEAIGHLEQARALARDTADRTSEGYALVNMGDSLSALGRHDEAARALEAGLDHFRAMGVRVSEGYALGILGDIEHARGRYPEAAAHLRRALDIARETGSPTNRSVALKHLGDVRLAQGRPDEAAQHLEEALGLARECGDRGVESRVLNSLGAVAAARGAYSDALRHHREALAVAKETGCRPEEGRAHCGLGEVRCALGDPEAARGHWERALACYAGECLPGARRVRNHLTALDRVAG